MKDLIRTMGFLYRFASLGRGKLTHGQLKEIESTGALLTNNAERVLHDGEALSRDERADLLQAVMMEQHITEVVQYIISQEII